MTLDAGDTARENGDTITLTAADEPADLFGLAVTFDSEGEVTLTAADDVPVGIVRDTSVNVPNRQSDDQVTVVTRGVVVAETDGAVSHGDTLEAGDDGLLTATSDPDPNANFVVVGVVDEDENLYEVLLR